jgi:YHS domain-containing protein
MNSHRKSGILILLFVVVFSTFAPEAHGNEDTNIMCPVLSDREATDDYSVAYKGEEIRFCCSECIIEFNKHPEIYESVLPQLKEIPLRTRMQLFMGEYGFLAVGFALLCALVALRIHRYRHPSTDPAEAGTYGRLLQKKISATIPLLILASYLGFEVYSLQSKLTERRLKDEIHFATFHDFGFPPTPKRPKTEPRLQASFYRGNDERSPKLFNNGNYRTAKFNISLCDQDRQTVAAGDNIKGRQLYLKFEIDRPPFTPDFLYNKEMMDTMFLTAECDYFLGRNAPVADEVGLTEIEPMQKWEAMFPITAKKSCCQPATFGDTVYVCEKYLKESNLPFVGKRQIGSRFHYAVRVDLNVKNDVVVDNSDMYMGALYRTRKLPTWRVPMTEWFSHEPIPELPGENVEDPELLGITDHIAKRNGTSGPQ